MEQLEYCQVASSEQISNSGENKRKKMEAWLPEAGMIETKKLYKSTRAEHYPKVSYMRPEGVMEYYKDQTRNS
jgi:hypothetical protein